MDRCHEATQLADEVARAAGRPGARRTIVLDVDGTLAPITPVPESTRVPEATLAALSGLVQGGWTVAVVSGRSARQTKALVPVRGVRIYGSHGLEEAWKAGQRAVLSTDAARRLSRLAAAARPLVATFEGARLELKPAGVALHDRGVAPGALPRWKRAVRRFLAEQDTAGFEVLPGRRVTELRPLGASKGNVIRALVPRRGRARLDASLVAVGDDVTDEDLFREVQGRGLGVKVGPRRAPTLATRTLPSPSAVQELLELLVESSRGATRLARRPRRRATPARGQRTRELGKP
jgi:trehalose-phosphatase